MPPPGIVLHRLPSGAVVHQEPPPPETEISIEVIRRLLRGAWMTVEFMPGGLWFHTGNGPIGYMTTGFDPERGVLRYELVQS